jgi:hypothetical protein
MVAIVKNDLLTVHLADIGAIKDIHHGKRAIMPVRLTRPIVFLLLTECAGPLRSSGAFAAW